MRRIAAFFPLFAAFLFVAPLAAHASGIPYFGPIVPTDASACAAGWGAVITVVNNIIAVALTIAIVFIAPLFIAWAGFLYLTSGASPGNRSKANAVLTNAIVGIVVALAGWIIVDAVMAALYNGSAGAWYQIINSNGSSDCLSIAGSLNQATLPNGQTGTVAGVGTDNAPLLTYGQGGACNAANIEAQDPSITSTQANQLACIAQGESTCGTGNNLNYSWNTDTGNGKASTAAGPYQVLLSSHSTCYDNAICEQAAGTPGQALNCKAAFDSNGFVTNQTLANTCAAAAANVGCSASAAVCATGGTTSGFQSAYSTDKYVSSCSTGS